MLALKTIFFLIVAPGITLFFIPFKIITSPINIEFEMSAIRFMAPLFWGIGTCISLWCVWDFFSKGKGTPAPIDPPKNLVIVGPYKYIRNPMYVGILLILLGHISWFESFSLIVYFFTLSVLFHSFVIFYEEPRLTKVFGKSYKSYIQQVPRWFPRIKKNA